MESFRRGRGGGRQLFFQQGRRGQGRRRMTARGGKAIAVHGDVARNADIDRLFAETKEAFGRLDILVNNARGERTHGFSRCRQKKAEVTHTAFRLTRGFRRLAIRK